MTCADQLLYTAVILTMDARNSEAAAMALAGDRILGVGSREELQKFVGPQTRPRDMEGQTIMPGFCDAHGHILLTADMLDWENLNSPPIDDCRCLDDCLARLRERAGRTPAGEWILAYGFDDTLMAEKRFPTREELDAISCGHPMFVQHISIHLGVLNSAGFAALGIDEHTPDPEGGIIRHHADGSLHGVVEERALFDLVSPRLPVFSRDHKVRNVARVSREVYAARGITTALDAGVLDYDGAEALLETYDRGLLAVRVHYNPYYYLDGDDPRLQSRGDRVRRGGVKIMSDGSIQGFTAYLSRPYHTPFRGDADWRGYPAYPREELFAIIKAAHRKGQFLIHANGDGAVDDALDALEAAQAKYPRTDCRHTLVHAQTIRDDQLDRLAAAGFTPTFFVPHTYYWGDSTATSSSGRSGPHAWTPYARPWTAGMSAPPTVIRPSRRFCPSCPSGSASTGSRPAAACWAARSASRCWKPCAPIPSMRPGSISRKGRRARWNPASWRTTSCWTPIP